MDSQDFRYGNKDRMRWMHSEYNHGVAWAARASDSGIIGQPELLGPIGSPGLPGPMILESLGDMGCWG
eukprot:5579973-Karenia_brevis.AAC.1